MKKQFVNTLEEGDVVNDYYVATRRDLRDTQSGGKFLGLVLKDRTGEIGGVLWHNAAAVAAKFSAGDVVNVRGTVNTYQSRLQLRVDQVYPLRAGEYETDDLVARTENTSETLKEYTTLLETIENPWLKKLIDSFLSDAEFLAKFEGASAGKRWHHAAAGGLLRHCYEMARIAETVGTLFPDLDRDLLQAGIFVHDMGKIEELSQGMHVDYTTVGKLVGHLQIGCLILTERINRIEEFPESLRLELLHLILSHHGEMEMGSPVVPKTLEAIVLSKIDDLDAQADAFVRVIGETRQKNQEWSDYITLIERQIWSKKPGPQ
ncbi:MAG: HD domain-containing protein [Candidatus Hydrogenedentes bacterium]|nr:HD domain-containing protein [Candidatus Hydrogenedentota bacterium]